MNRNPIIGENIKLINKDMTKKGKIMGKYFVYKKLYYATTIEADSEEEAKEKMKELNIPIEEYEDESYVEEAW